MKPSISVIAERDDPRDAWICPKYESIENLPKGATVGTSSLRDFITSPKRRRAALI